MRRTGSTSRHPLPKRASSPCCSTHCTTHASSTHTHKVRCHCYLTLAERRLRCDRRSGRHSERPPVELLAKLLHTSCGVPRCCRRGVKLQERADHHKRRCRWCTQHPVALGAFPDDETALDEPAKVRRDPESPEIPVSSAIGTGSAKWYLALPVPNTFVRKRVLCLSPSRMGAWHCECHLAL